MGGETEAMDTGPAKLSVEEGKQVSYLALTLPLNLWDLTFPPLKWECDPCKLQVCKGS